jgi:Predicted transcriptional regulators
MENKHKEIHNKLKLNIFYTREKQGLNQPQLAEKAGISKTHLSNIEALDSNTVPSLAVLIDIANALNISLEKLFDFGD